LDMAESELAVLTTQCLSRRIPDKQTLEREVAAWQDHRNKHHAKADWQFTTDDARVKLKRLYPQVGIPFTHVGTTGSAGGCIGRSIPSLGLITLGRFRSSWRGLTTSRLQAQSSTLYGPRVALPLARSTSHCPRAGAVPSDHRNQPTRPSPRGYVREGDTHFGGFAPKGASASGRNFRSSNAATQSVAAHCA